jgi:hypothetical protein
MVVKMSMVVLLIVTPCVLRNVGNHLEHYTAQNTTVNELIPDTVWERYVYV